MFVDNYGIIFNNINWIDRFLESNYMKRKFEIFNCYQCQLKKEKHEFKKTLIFGTQKKPRQRKRCGQAKRNESLGPEDRGFLTNGQSSIWGINSTKRCEKAQKRRTKEHKGPLNHFHDIFPFGFLPGQGELNIFIAFNNSPNFRCLIYIYPLF